jgi:hypothetical protein
MTSHGLDAEMPIQAPGFSLTMAEIYEGAVFDLPAPHVGDGD